MLNDKHSVKIKIWHRRGVLAVVLGREVGLGAVGVVRRLIVAVWEATANSLRLLIIEEPSFDNSLTSHRQQC